MREPAMRIEDRQAYVFDRWDQEHLSAVGHLLRWLGVDRAVVRLPVVCRLVDPDPRVNMFCKGCGQTFAWKDYEPWCGWCFWFPELREVD